MTRRKRSTFGGLSFGPTGATSHQRSWFDHAPVTDVRLPRAAIAGIRPEFKHLAAFALALGLCSSVEAVTPTWNSVSSALGVTQDAGSPEPVGSTYGSLVTINAGAASLSAPFNSHTIH